MAEAFPFPVEKEHFLGLSAKDQKAAGLDPKNRICVLWFGLLADLDEVPERCPVRLSGRSQYKFFVNGTEVLFGPCRGEKEISYVDALDLAPYLVPGTNKLLFQVFSYPEHPEDRTQEGPNYCYGDDDGPAIMMVGRIGTTDLADPASWHIFVDQAASFNADEIFLVGATECVDGKKALENPFAGAAWDLAKTLPAAIVQLYPWDPYGDLQGKVFQDRPIPLLYRREKTFPGWEKREIPAHTKERFVLDAGGLTTAFFRIGFSGGACAEVTLTYAESYFKVRPDGTRYKGVRDDTTGVILGVHDSYVCGGGEEIYEPFRFRTFRFVEVAVETKDAPLAILPQSFVETAYPIENTKRPAFSDPAREKLYDTALRTLQLCSHDTFEDCPYYEQLQYACDTRLEILFTYACSDDVRLPRHAIDLLAASLRPDGLIQSRNPSRVPQVIPGFSLYFVLMLEDYILETGDIEAMRPYIPAGERILESFLAKKTPDGLLAPRGYWDFADWTREWDGHFGVPTAVRDGASALQNLQFVYAAQSFARILPRYGRADLAEELTKTCGQILAAVERTCFDASRGLYQEGPATEEFSQHTQIFAVLTGLVSGEKARGLMERVLADDTLVQCSFSQKFYLFRALEQVGLYDRTDALWAPWQKFLDLHCTTFPETPYDPRSDCHAWSALPLYEFARHGA